MMTRKIFRITSLFLILSLIFTSFVAAENAQKKETVEKTEASPTDIWEEFEVEETPTPTPPPTTSTKEAPSDLVWWAIGVGLAALLLAVIAISFAEALRRRIVQLEEGPPDAPEQPQEPQPEQQAGPGANAILMMIGVGILTALLAFGPIAYAQAPAPTAKKTVTLKDGVETNQKRIIALKRKIDALEDEIKKISAKIDKLTPPTTPAPKPKKGTKPATTTGLTEAQVAQMIRAEIRSKSVELPSIRKNGWAARTEEELRSLRKEIKNLQKALASTKKSLQAEAQARAQGDRSLEAKIPEPFDTQQFGLALAKLLKNGFVTRVEFNTKADKAEVEDLQNQVDDLADEVSTKAGKAKVDEIRTSVQGAEENLGKLAAALELLAKTRGKGTKISQPPILPFLGRDPKFKEGDEATKAAQKAAQVAEEIAAKYAELE